MDFELPRRRLVGLVLGGAGFAVAGRRAVAAPALPAPTEKPLLTITGKIRIFNSFDAVQLDRAGLEGLGMASFVTNTPWYSEPVEFEGVPMARLMAAVGAFGTTTIATALNDYVTEIPVSDFSAYNVMLALKRDGEYMPLRDKGPLFIVYPYDSDPALQHQRFYSRSAWQVAHLIVR